MEAAHDEAWEILSEYREVLDELVLRLMDKETVSKDEVLELFASVSKRPNRGSYTGWGKRKPSDVPPVLTPRELALLGPKDVENLLPGNGKPRANGRRNGRTAERQTTARASARHQRGERSA